MGGTSPVRRKMVCPACGNQSVDVTLRFGDLRPKREKPATLIQENHFPPFKRELCDLSEKVLLRAFWPAWAIEAVVHHNAKKGKVR